MHQEKCLFPNLSTLENLQLAAYAIGKTKNLQARLEDTYKLFPILRDGKEQLAETLSGGQQKQLAVRIRICRGRVNSRRKAVRQPGGKEATNHGMA